MVFTEFINGLVTGSDYALVALGVTLVYGVIRLINFAQFSLLTVGAYIGYFLAPVVLRVLGVGGPWFDLVVIVAASGIGAGLIGTLASTIGWLPLRRAAPLSMLVSSLALMVLIENLIQVVISPVTLSVTAPVAVTTFQVGPAYVTNLELFTFVVALGLAGALAYAIKYTRLGMALRALGSDRTSAELMGVEASRMILLAFGLAAALAGVAGVMIANTYGVAYFNMGDLIGLKGFTAAVLGGMGNLYGAVVGGLVLGVIESMSTFVLPTQWTEVVAFVILIVVLALRPGGIFPNPSVDRV